ncbi:alpha/beta fold hydrolase [Pseudodonghicola xiamenensis]|uniref:Alpha/beta hydrolase n=1 Tax=Pseudodonghicola xiamenensis TaxID=337702 RepID=A0A8J3HAW1_9RHOB|nr:alpha/beta hydrolase [Pseudodonghicola xiamenensis]GHG98833.1 alpha/beta hydrolase [Pseudodonghicola xiamenensis]
MDLAVLPQPVFSRDFGEGARRALAIHCTLAHSGALRGLAAALGDDLTITAFDLLSHGQSPDWDGQGDIYERHIAIAETFLTEPMDLIGHSFGATVALGLAAAHPEMVRSLTLIEPVYFAFAGLQAPELLAQHEADALPFSEALLRGDIETGTRLFNAMWGGDAGPGWEALPERARVGMIRGIPLVPASQRALFHDAAGLTAPGALDAVSMPVLLLRGSDSHPVVSAIHAGLAARLADVRSEVVEGAGHMLPITHPEQVATHLRAMLARTEA